MTTRLLASIAAVLTRTVVGAAWAQFVLDEACPRYAVIVAAFAACDSDRTAHSAWPANPTAEQLLPLKS